MLKDIEEKEEYVSSLREKYTKDEIMELIAVLTPLYSTASQNHSRAYVLLEQKIIELVTML